MAVQLALVRTPSSVLPLLSMMVAIPNDAVKESPMLRIMSPQLRERNRELETIEKQLPEQESRKPKRQFNALVNSPVMEDYSLRYAPRSFRKWSEYAVATAALGGIAYLADYAIGASIAVTHGFANAFWAILIAAVVIFLTGIPIAYYSAKYNIDMDLLTRGAGFGYLGSTITSLIYASFTFIF